MIYMLLVVTTVLKSGMVRIVVSVVDSEALPLEVIFAIIRRLVGVFICYNRQQTPETSIRRDSVLRTKIGEKSHED